MLHTFSYAYRNGMGVGVESCSGGPTRSGFGEAGGGGVRESMAISIHGLLTSTPLEYNYIYQGSSLGQVKVTQMI